MKSLKQEFDIMTVETTKLPTLYEHYVGNGIRSGLSVNQPYFTLNEKNITIYSGAFHYFRVPRAYWRDRLRKMRAAGLNTVETYVPWNLHEPESGKYDFGQGNTDMEDFLHIEEFLKTAQEEDLLAIVRPGPYICAEFDFGGLPSWLLRNTNKVRSSKDYNYMAYVKRFFKALLPILTLLQFQKGGPIIGFQVENEFGSTREHDQKYLKVLRNIMLDNGVIELLFTSDGITFMELGSIPGVLSTVNLFGDIKKNLGVLNNSQPNKPQMVMETYSGWFDHWGEKHHTASAVEFLMLLNDILENNASVNIYMFTGGTSFGFLNGGNKDKEASDNSDMQFDTNSYDYDSPITEFGGYTKKYNNIKELIELKTSVKTKIPEQPDVKPATTYPQLDPQGQILLADIIDSSEVKIASRNILPMEMLPVNNNNGQSYGYTVYRKSNITIKSGAILKISGFVRDTVMVLINGKLISNVPKTENDLNGFGFWKLNNSLLTLTSNEIKGATLDLVVENFGRNGFGRLNTLRQFKGLTDNVYINNKNIKHWEIVPLEFKTNWNKKLEGWKNITNTTGTPALYKFVLNIFNDPQDTFIDMRGWTKGIAIVNGFVLGRHFFIGPQQTSYLPAPFLRLGTNEIIIFEHYDAPKCLKFSNVPIYGNE